jgi:hypothetical protein
LAVAKKGRPARKSPWAPRWFKPKTWCFFTWFKHQTMVTSLDFTCEHPKTGKMMINQWIRCLHHSILWSKISQWLWWVNGNLGCIHDWNESIIWTCAQTCAIVFHCFLTWRPPNLDPKPDFPATWMCFKLGRHSPKHCKLKGSIDIRIHPSIWGRVWTQQGHRVIKKASTSISRQWQGTFWEIHERHLNDHFQWYRSDVVIICPNFPHDISFSPHSNAIFVG